MRSFRDEEQVSVKGCVLTGAFYVLLTAIPVILIIFFFRMAGCCSFG